MMNLDQPVAIAIGVSVCGCVVLGLGDMIRDVAAIQRAIFLPRRSNQAKLRRELAEVKTLLVEQE